MARKTRQYDYKMVNFQISADLWKKFEYVARTQKFKDPIPLLKDIVVENVEKWTQWGYFKDFDIDPEEYEQIRLEVKKRLENKEKPE